MINGSDFVIVSHLVVLPYLELGTLNSPWDNERWIYLTAELYEIIEFVCWHCAVTPSVGLLCDKEVNVSTQLVLPVPRDVRLALEDRMSR